MWTFRSTLKNNRECLMMTVDICSKLEYLENMKIKWRYFALGEFKSSPGVPDHGSYVTGIVEAENKDDAADLVADIVSHLREGGIIIEWWVVLL